MLVETSDAGVWICMLRQVVGWLQMSKSRLKNWKKRWWIICGVLIEKTFLTQGCWGMIKSYAALETASQNCGCRYSVGSFHKSADPNVDPTIL